MKIRIILFKNWKLLFENTNQTRCFLSISSWLHLSWSYLCVCVSLTVCDFNSHTKKWPNGLNASTLSFFLHSETCLTSLFIKRSLTSVTCHRRLGDKLAKWASTNVASKWAGPTQCYDTGKYLHTSGALYVALWCTQHLGISSQSLPPNWLYSRNARIQGHKLWSRPCTLHWRMAITFDQTIGWS